MYICSYQSFEVSPRVLIVKPENPASRVQSSHSITLALSDEVCCAYRPDQANHKLG